MKYSGFTKLYLLVVIFLMIYSVYETNGQTLNDPSQMYRSTRLGVRKVYWCPSGYGYLSYCPQPTDWDNYGWCCIWPYMGTWKPACCPFAIPTGALVGVIISAIIVLAVFIALSCWCCVFCPLHKELYDVK